MTKFKSLVNIVFASLLMFSSVNVYASEINESSLPDKVKNDEFHSHAILLKAEDTVNLSLHLYYNERL